MILVGILYDERKIWLKDLNVCAHRGNGEVVNEKYFIVRIEKNLEDTQRQLGECSKNH